MNAAPCQSRTASGKSRVSFAWQNARTNSPSFFKDFAEKGAFMITASLAYVILSRDLPKSLDRVANQTQVKKDAQYYADNINKVKDVDDFLGDYKLYSYAMKAYGIDDMIYAKAFMKKVLESDLTDANSFAN